MDALQILAGCVAPFVCVVDEILDIVYVVENWDSFANEDLRNAALAFVLLQPIVLFVIFAIYYWCYARKQNFHPCMIIFYPFTTTIVAWAKVDVAVQCMMDFP